jgi:hypothetical protein
MVSILAAALCAMEVILGTARQRLINAACRSATLCECPVSAR